MKKSCSDRAEALKEEIDKGSDFFFLKGGLLVKKDGTGEKQTEGGGENSEKGRDRERQTCLSLPSLWYDKFMHSSCVCQSRLGVFVGQFLREEGGKRGRRGKKAREGEKGGERELRH